MTAHQRNLSDAIGFLETDTADAVSAAELAIAEAKRTTGDAGCAAEIRAVRVLGLMRAVAAVVHVARDLAEPADDA